MRKYKRGSLSGCFSEAASTFRGGLGCTCLRGSREARETASIPSAGSLGGKVHCSHFLRGEPAGEPLEQSPPGSKPESCRDQAGQSQNRASKAEN